VLPAYRIAVFVHGCFWHLHGCSAGRALPKTRLDYWLPKLEGNRRRDRSAVRELHRLGWQTVVIWECQTEGEERLDRALRSTLLRHVGRFPSQRR
jgi:DNA mismatch endonuclease (patch repair protein)